MGCGVSELLSGVSELLPAPENFPYFCMTFHSADVFRLIYADRRTQVLIKKCLENHWGKKFGKAIASLSWFAGALDIQITGRPFIKGSTDIISLNVTLCHMLEYLHADGW